MPKKTFLLILILLFVRIPALQSTDWQEFFPLHLGDYWVYKVLEIMPYIETNRVISCDTMENEQVYAKIQSYSRGSTGYGYRRVDDLGDVYEYDFNKHERLLFKLNVCLGDSWPDLAMGGYWKVVEKIDQITDDDTLTSLAIQSFENLAFTTYRISEKIGIVHISFECGQSGLLGACINGQLWGDTLTTNVVKRNIGTLPDEMYLVQNYPNPFNSITTIEYNLYSASAVRLRVHDIQGKKVLEIDNGFQQPGNYKVSVDMGELPSGIYLYKIVCLNYEITKTMLLLK